MQIKALYILHIYIDADYKKVVFYAAPILYVCRYSVAMSTRVCNVILTDFVKKSGFECCFWSAPCIETQSRTCDNVKNWVFISLHVRWWSLSDNVMYCNTLRSIKDAFFELEIAIFTDATLVPIFTIITPCPYAQSKQSKAIHAKCILNLDCEKMWVW